MLTYGFEGAIRIASAASIASSTPGAACASPSKRTPSTSSRWPRATNHSWKAKLPAGVSIQVRSRSSVAGRIAGSIPSARASRARDGGERLARAKRLRPDEVEAEIAVAEPEPVLAAERRDRAERLPGLAGPAPASLLVVQAGEGVEDAVEVGRDGHPEHLEVVADVADDGDIRAARHVDEAAREARAADAAGEEDDLHGCRTRPIAACVLGPARRPTRRRSSIVSTSSPRFGIAQAIAGTPMLSACSRKRAALPPP